MFYKTQFPGLNHLFLIQWDSLNISVKLFFTFDTFLGSGRWTETRFLFRRYLATTTKGTIKYKIRIKFRHMKNEKWNLWQREQQNPNVKEKKKQLIFSIIWNFSSHVYEKNWDICYVDAVQKYQWSTCRVFKVELWYKYEADCQI